MFFDYPLMENRRCAKCKKYWYELDGMNLSKTTTICKNCADELILKAKIKKVKNNSLIKDQVIKIAINARGEICSF